MKFIEPSFKELYCTLKNNSKLEKFLIKNKVLNDITDYYENYGYDETKRDTANEIIEEANKITYENITKVLLSCLKYIKDI